MRAPLLYQLYVAITVLLVPFAAWIETRKLRRDGFSAMRAHEKLGHASAPRTGSGPLIWFHAASVGESLSVLALMSHMGKILPRAHFLITSGTTTSARIVATRMPPRCVHQFAPLDAPGPVSRFLKHWRPDAAIFVESELWPQMLRRTRSRGAAMALVNARLSARSRASWAKRPALASYVLNVFDLILTQNDAMAQAMVDMHAPADRVARGFNLKSLSDPLPQDPSVTAKVRTALKGRPIWIAASTHPGEEEIILQAHGMLLQSIPELLLILVPRHPERRADIRQLIKSAGHSFTTRSQGGVPQHEQVYLADTLGELGSWYALSDVIFVGGSLKPIGGHNPFEVAQAGAPVITGPHVTNFAETYGEMEARGGAIFVEDAQSLAAVVTRLMHDTAFHNKAKMASRGFVQGKSDQLASIATRLVRALKLEED